MKVERVVGSSLVGIVLLVEPIEIDVPDSLVAELPPYSICWLDCTDFERDRRLDDGTQRC